MPGSFFDENDKDKIGGVEKVMGFQVKYEEITSIRELILAQLDRWIEQIDVVRCMERQQSM